MANQTLLLSCSMAQGAVTDMGTAALRAFLGELTFTGGTM